MTNREQYERMIYFDDGEVDILLDALLEARDIWGSPFYEQAEQLRNKIIKHYNVEVENGN